MKYKTIGRDGKVIEVEYGTTKTLPQEPAVQVQTALQIESETSDADLQIESQETDSMYKQTITKNKKRY